MTESFRVGLASQTPLARMLRTLEDLERERGPLPDPVDISALVRSRDYSVTPGGVARMLVSAIRSGPGRALSGEWVALSNGFPRDLSLGAFRLTSVRLPPERRAGYGRFKEAVWSGLNNLATPPAGPEDPPLAAARPDFEAFAEAAAARLAAAHRREPVSAYYAHDFHLLAAGPHLPDAPRVLHYHVPFAPWTPEPWRRYVVRHLAEFDAVIVSTRAYAKALADEGLDRPVHVIPPWLSTRGFAPPPREGVDAFADRFGIDPGDEVVLHVARMDPMKGQDRLVAALPTLLDARPRARLVLVGNGSFSSSKKGGMGLSKGALWRNRLERLVADLGVADHVTFTGHLPQAAVVAALHRAQVFAFPSVAEGFGLAPIEAWLAGKPVVVSDGAGMSEHVADGETGWVVHGDDPHAWARRLAGLLADESNARDLGRKGRATALRVCDVEERARDVLAVLRSAERRAAARALVS